MRVLPLSGHFLRLISILRFLCSESRTHTRVVQYEYTHYVFILPNSWMEKYSAQTGGVLTDSLPPCREFSELAGEKVLVRK